MVELLKPLYDTRSFGVFIAQTTPEGKGPILHYAVQNRDTKVIEYQNDIFSTTRRHVKEMQADLDDLDGIMPATKTVN